MALTLSGSNGVAGVDGSAGTPALQGSDTNTGIAFGSDTILGSTGGTERFRVDSSGRFGIGTASPATNLHVAGNILVREADYIYGNATTGNRSYIQMYGSASGEMTIATTFSNSFIKFLTADTERMRINSAGRLSVGYAPSVASHTLDIRSNETSSGVVGFYQANASWGGTAVYIEVNRATTDSTYNFLRCIQQGTTDKLFIRDSGTVQNATGTYNTISDIKLKENIIDAPSQWDDIKNIRIRNYNFKSETNHQTHKQIGVVAQELELVCPGLVEEAPDLDAEGNDLGTTTKGVKSSILYMKAVKALQEAMERIESLETRLAALEVTP